ncbi:MAG TPA: hypothetical protein EYP19_07245, partial [Desulfobacterales bacterium]|nr:hypothetical protein [Desulfobacterales bacterium]
VGFLRSWFSAKYQQFRSRDLSGEELREALLGDIERIGRVESISFAKAVKAAFRALLDKQEEDFVTVCQWLSGEPYDRRAHGRYGILQRIDRTTAFTMVRSLVQWIREIGYSGLIILLDEAERVPSLSTKQREQHLSNLREVIDECGHTSFKAAMIFYAVPDGTFLEGRAQIYEALRQRVATVFDDLNPTGVKIELERLSIDPFEFLVNVGQRLREIYEIAYDHRFDPAKAEETIELAANSAYEERFGDIGYKRLFVQRCIRGLHYLRREGRSPSVDEVRR